MPMQERPDGEMILITGKSRSGKTTEATRLTANDERLAVFDYPGRDWPSQRCERIVGMPAFCHRILEAGSGPARISYQGELDTKHFGDWSSVALAWQHDAPGTVVAEELADVTNAGKACRGWGELVRGGMAYGTKIVGITQRIQEVDSSIFGNATEMRIFWQNKDSDYKYIAKQTGIDIEMLRSLKRFEFLLKTDRSDIV